MKIQVIGCAGTVSPESKTSAFLVNGNFLLDGGTVCSSLPMETIEKIKTIFISHPHFDHIKGIPSLAETLIFMEATTPVTLFASEKAVTSIRHHIMNDIIWPDFSKLPTAEHPVIRYREIPEGVAVQVGDITVTPHFLCNNTSDFGYLLENGSTSLLYTSDIGADARLCINGVVPESMIIEVSFPNEKGDLAAHTGHLTPKLMQNMLQKLPSSPRNIYISHMKTYFRDQIVRQLLELQMPGLVILNDGDTLNL